MNITRQKKTARFFVGICSALILGITTIIGLINMNKSEAASSDIIEGITKSMLPANPTVYEKTTVGEETFELKSGSIYFLEVWGGKGGKGGYTTGGAGGKGSYAFGWYDMRSSADVTASIFSGGSGGNGVEVTSGSSAVGGGSGWALTQFNIQFQGTQGGSGFFSGGGGGGTSCICIGTTALLVAGGGGGGGGGGSITGGAGGGLKGDNGSGGKSTGGMGATQSAHGNRGSDMGMGTTNTAGSESGGGNSGLAGAGGGAGGGWTRGYAGGGGGIQPTDYEFNFYNGGGGGGSGGTSYIGGVKSLSDSEAGTQWEVNDGNGKVRITEYLMGYGVNVPIDGTDYTVSAPSEMLVLPGESYTFTITRTSGTGHVGLVLNSGNGILELTSTNGNVFTYTVSDVQGSIASTDFSVATYNVEAPPDDEGYSISPPSSTSVLMGGSYSFVITLDVGYAMPIVVLNTTNGKISYNGIDFGEMTVTVSNVVGEITADDFIISVSRIQ